jgi:3-methyladenine DNA glycosylase/8-oxoguanine DNA glycosylase
VRVLQRRPSNPVDLWNQDRYQRVLAMPEGLVLIEVRNRGTIDEPDVYFSIRRGEVSRTSRLAVAATLRRVLGLDIDPQPLRELAESERSVRATAIALHGMRPPRFASLFEAFANVVPFQQLSLDAGVAIVARLVEKFGARLDHQSRRFHAFPTAETIAEARLHSLRACGLSARKAQTVRDLARVVASGALTEEQLSGMGTDVALETLVQLPGIGPWSAAVVLLRGLGRMDVFPPGDVGAARGLRLLTGLGPRAPLSRVIEHFGEYRGYLYFCALGAGLLGRGLVQGSATAA